LPSYAEIRRRTLLSLFGRLGVVPAWEVTAGAH
jgi:hypothetical protein